MSMMESVTSGISSVIGWIGEVVTSLTTTEGALNGLLPLFAVGISISAILVGIRVCRGLIWGA